MSAWTKDYISQLPLHLAVAMCLHSTQWDDSRSTQTQLLGPFFNRHLASTLDTLCPFLYPALWKPGYNGWTPAAMLMAQHGLTPRHVGRGLAGRTWV